MDIAITGVPQSHDGLAGVWPQAQTRTDAKNKTTTMYRCSSAMWAEFVKFSTCVLKCQAIPRFSCNTCSRCWANPKLFGMARVTCETVRGRGCNKSMWSQSFWQPIFLKSCWIATKGGIHFYNKTARSAMFDNPNFVPNSSPLIQFDSLMNLSWPFIIIYHPNPD